MPSIPKKRRIPKNIIQIIGFILPLNEKEAIKFTLMYTIFASILFFYDFPNFYYASCLISLIAIIYLMIYLNFNEISLYITKHLPLYCEEINHDIPKTKTNRKKRK